MVVGPSNTTSPNPTPNMMVVDSKLVPPTSGRALIPRRVVAERVTGTERVVLIVAPPGYGKSVVASQCIADAADRSQAVAWLSVDLIDGDDTVFWSHLVASLHRAGVSIGDEVAHLLAEQGASPIFLATLCQRICTSDDAVTLALDDIDRMSRQRVMPGIEFLVERCDGRLRLIATGRLDPELPVARWRAQGWITEIRQADLRFDLQESSAFLDTLGPTLLDAADTAALHTRVEGWAAGLQLAMLAVASTDDPHLAVQSIAGSDRAFADYMITEVLRPLEPAQLDTALTLSVLTWFDADLTEQFAGPSSVTALRHLRDRHLFITELGDSGRYRYHALFREMLENELRWRDPERHRALHRRAADVMSRCDDHISEYRHLMAIGEWDEAQRALVTPAMKLIDTGQATDFSAALMTLPGDIDIDDADRAIELALAFVAIARLRRASRWVDRAEQLSDPDDRERHFPIAMLRFIVAMGNGDDAVAEAELATCDRLRTQSEPTWHYAPRFAAMAARWAVGTHRPDATARLDDLRGYSGPPVMTRLALPALTAIELLHAGDLGGATTHAAPLGDVAREIDIGDHASHLEARLAWGMCLLGAGRLELADEVIEPARDNTIWADPWHQARTGIIAVEIQRLRVGGPDAMLVADDLDRRCATRTRHGISDRLVAQARGSALIACGRADEALDVLHGLPDQESVRLLRCRADLALGRFESVLAVADAAEHWPAPLAIEAGVLGALATTGTEADERLTAALHRAGETGWISPLLGHGDALERLLRRLPVGDLHPDFAALRDQATPQPNGAARSALRLEPLTDREQTLLVLLPTHLSYADMGQQLFVSVNTVKTNMKALYRKLNCSTRADAVRIARSAGLITALGDTVPGDSLPGDSLQA